MYCVYISSELLVVDSAANLHNHRVPTRYQMKVLDFNNTNIHGATTYPVYSPLSLRTKECFQWAPNFYDWESLSKSPQAIFVPDTGENASFGREGGGSLIS